MAQLKELWHTRHTQIRHWASVSLDRLGALKDKGIRKVDCFRYPVYKSRSDLPLCLLGTCVSVQPAALLPAPACVCVCTCGCVYVRVRVSLCAQRELAHEERHVRAWA